MSLVQTSKFLSLILRHEPGRIGLTLDVNGWADVDDLLTLAKAHGKPIGRADLEQIVRDSDKQRFAFSEDGTRIRANQGHSIEVELNLAAVVPPEKLLHGTARRNLESILREGLRRGKRHHVHLSADIQTATAVGRRHGEVVILEVDAGRMASEGISFYRSENGVWLVDEVPCQFLRVLI